MTRREKEREKKREKKPTFPDTKREVFGVPRSNHTSLVGVGEGASSSRRSKQVACAFRSSQERRERKREKDRSRQGNQPTTKRTRRAKYDFRERKTQFIPGNQGRTSPRTLTTHPESRVKKPKQEGDEFPCRAPMGERQKRPVRKEEPHPIERHIVHGRQKQEKGQHFALLKGLKDKNRVTFRGQTT